MAAMVKKRASKGPAVQSNGFQVISSPPNSMADPCDGFWHNEPTAAVRHMISWASEAQMRRWPELRARRSEDTLVQRQRFGILPTIDHLGLGAAGSGVVVQRCPQPLSASDHPIVA